jgi:hypothetical protein
MTSPLRPVGTRIRRTGDLVGGSGPAPAPTDRHRPAPAFPPRVGARADLDENGGKPRSVGRPMPEYPKEGYVGYRLFGTPPAVAGKLVRLTDWLLGRVGSYLYMGITVRAGFVRWVEHSDTKAWARDVTTAEVIEGEWWATFHDTVICERTGKPWLVWDPSATADDGIRPVHPGELVDSDPTPGSKHGEDVEVFALDAVAGVLLPGLVVEGAATGEKRIIQAWDGGPRPIHNIQHNEGEHAVNRVKRQVPRLVAIARRRALASALVWLALTALLGWWCAGALAPGTAALVGLGAAAGVLQGAQVLRLALTGLAAGRRRRPRKPRGSPAKQRARRAFLRARRRRR